jgi:hypothetical protein
MKDSNTTDDLPEEEFQKWEYFFRECFGEHYRGYKQEKPVDEVFQEDEGWRC